MYGLGRYCNITDTLRSTYLPYAFASYIRTKTILLIRGKKVNSPRPRNCASALIFEARLLLAQALLKRYGQESVQSDELRSFDEGIKQNEQQSCPRSCRRYLRVELPRRPIHNLEAFEVCR